MSSQIQTLKSFFPGVPDSVLQETLREANGNLDRAASALLEKSSALSKPQKADLSATKVHKFSFPKQKRQTKQFLHKNIVSEIYNLKNLKALEQIF